MHLQILDGKQGRQGKYIERYESAKSQIREMGVENFWLFTAIPGIARSRADKQLNKASKSIQQDVLILI